MTNETANTGITLNKLAIECSRVAEEKGWKTDWTEGGSYLHLEASEFVESLRGKKGEPYKELGDVMFVLLAMARDHNVSMIDVIDAMVVRHSLDVSKVQMPD